MKPMLPVLLCDGYKLGHVQQYPNGTEFVYSNFTPRKARDPNTTHYVFFGLQYFIEEYLVRQFNENFFARNIDEICKEFEDFCNSYIGPDKVSSDHIRALHGLGCLPLLIKALPEGSVVPMGVPCLTVVNTHPDFFWVTNSIETLLSMVLWGPINSATIAWQYRKLLDEFALKTGGDTLNVLSQVQFQGHDFSARGMFGLEACCLSGAGHLLSFTGTDSIPSILFLKNYYEAGDGMIGCTVPATEHSVMCMGEQLNERDTFLRLIRDVYPTGIVSIVSDTWNLWDVLTQILPSIHDEVMGRNGKLVIRPDSGDPVEILCGIEIPDFTEDGELVSAWRSAKDAIVTRVREETPHGEMGVGLESLIFKFEDKHYKATVEFEWNRHDKLYYYMDEKRLVKQEEHTPSPAELGVIELLWDVFGGTTNALGFRELDPHIGAIYGDSITLARAKEICERLAAKRFASSNVVLGIGSYTYQYNTRDTLGMAMKSTWGVVNGVPTEIHKNPVTDSGMKKSLKGLLRIIYDDATEEYAVQDQVTKEQEATGHLFTVFDDGHHDNVTTLSWVRNRLWGSRHD
jgi:nicotinamide phosphoribosyltransferase